MADIINKLGGLASLDDTQTNKLLLTRLKPRLRAYEDGQKAVLKQNAGSSIEWTRFESIDIDITETVEGVTPTPIELKPTPIVATVHEFSQGMVLSNRLLNRGKHKCRGEAIQTLSENGAKGIDRITLNAMLAATKQYFGKSKTDTTITASDYITAGDVERMSVYLADNNAVRFDDDCYHALLTPKMAAEVRKLPLFVDKSKYQDPRGEGICKGEIGTLLGIKFMETTNIPPKAFGASNAVTCERLIAYGKDAYGVVDVEEAGSRGMPQMIHKGLGSAGTADYANQRASEAIRFEYAAKILDEKRICVFNAPTSIIL